MVVQAGDVIFFKKTDSIITETIADITHSDYTHVGLMIDDRLMIESNGFIRTRIIPLELVTDQYEVHRIPSLTDEQKRKIIDFAICQVGTKYDYEKILGLLIRFEFLRKFKGFDEANRFICSELVDLAFHAGDVPRHTQSQLGNVSPSELFCYYDFEFIGRSA